MRVRVRAYGGYRMKAVYALWFMHLSDCVSDWALTKAREPHGKSFINRFPRTRMVVQNDYSQINYWRRQYYRYCNLNSNCLALR